MKPFVLKALNYIWLVCTLLACAFSSVSYSLADERYKCGASNQDIPCKITVNSKSGDSKPAIVTQPANKAAFPSVAKANCQQRGEIAKGIAVLRDARKSENQQLQATTDSNLQALIRDVYSHSGSALQVQHRVERECTQQQVKDRLIKKQWAESEKLHSASETEENKPKAPAKANAEIPDQLTEPEITSPAIAEPVQASLPAQTIQQTPVEPIQQAARPASIKPKAEIKEVEQGDALGICSAFRAGLENIANEQRKGGDAATIKALKQQQNQLKSEMKSSGC